MSETVIRVEDLGKRYRIGALQKPRTRGQELLQLVRTPFSYLARTLRPAHEEEILWALRNVSFEVKRGEVVGIIGRNGAGKSTLLKILSRITDPTEGSAELHGRVGSLLEVGTGFHPELTGRENIYLNGAILGMKKAEIARKFDEIVSFAEVERFIDTPVKHYSSGMYVRLAFAVAAHLETEILLVDEVLAVGDAAFQEKCLGKMHDAATRGRTVLFVSHNMSAVKALCKRALLLDSGRLSAIGATDEVLRSYFCEVRVTKPSAGPRPMTATQPFAITAWGTGTIKDSERRVANTVGDVELWFICQTHEVANGEILLSFALRDQDANLSLVVHNELEQFHMQASAGRSVIRVVIHDVNLRPGTYSLEVEVYLDRKLVLQECLGSIHLLGRPFFADGAIVSEFPASCLFRSEWKYESI